MEDVSGITSMLKDLIGGEIETPKGPEFTEEISLPYTRDLLETRMVGDDTAPKIPLFDGMTTHRTTWIILGTPPETYKDLLCEATSYSRVEQLNLARKATTRPNLEAPEPYRPKEKRSNDYAYDR
ncbi:PREDICTED: LOC110762444 [Prunus dulcis]|uniref:PREDICTED: LOC110762444 n=1 Tax=Prunus dulcis TaxID=3755 RepID=A0A5E4GGV8_PRUDU|nr:PREDICTED: LOC110762444 [Prunus dulcis]